MNHRYLIVLAGMALSVCGVRAHAGEGVGGNATGKAVLLGFEDAQAHSAQLRRAIREARRLVDSLQVPSDGSDSDGLFSPEFPGLEELRMLPKEIQESRYIRIREPRKYDPNRFPGDHTIGGVLVASTDARRGAPTFVFPDFFALSPSQMVQAVIHEALHRSLPEPLNQYENVVERLTDVITLYSHPADELMFYLIEVRGKRLAWRVNFVAAKAERCRAARNQLVINLQDSDVAIETDRLARISIELECDPVRDDRSPYGIVRIRDRYTGDIRMVDLMAANPGYRPFKGPPNANGARLRCSTYVCGDLYRTAKSAEAVQQALDQVSRSDQH